MWQAFVSTLSLGYKNVFDLVVSISTLALVNNSEKILHAMGFKAVSYNSTKGAVSSGVGALMRIVSMEEKAIHNATHIFNNRKNISEKDSRPIIENKTETPPYLADNSFGFVDGVGYTDSQKEGIYDVKEAVNNSTYTSADTLTNALGISEESNYHINGYGSDRTAFRAEATSDDKTIQGFAMSSVIDNRDGSSRIVDSFVTASPEGHNVLPPDTMVTIYDRQNEIYKEMYTTSIIDKVNGSYVYRMSDKPHHKPEENKKEIIKTDKVTSDGIPT